VTHLLDSSAFLAYFFDQPGAIRVRSLFEDEQCAVAISVLSALEFWARLKAVNRDAEFENEWEVHSLLFDAVLEVDWKITERAIALRRATPERLPTTDSLIAATAAIHGLMLVHRDPHFRAIPGQSLLQLDLEAPGPPS
jgi:predicted nucleic acid-binding protein